MRISELRTCKQCGIEQPLNKNYFGHTPSGSFRHQCRSCINENSKKHWKKNPDILERNWRKRASRKRGSWKPSSELILKLKKDLNYQCAYCEKKLSDGYEIEHVIPLAKGGEDNEQNITLSCKECNADKCAKTNQEFYEWKKLRGYPMRMLLISGEDRMEYFN